MSHAMSEITRGMGHFSTLYLNMTDEALYRHRLWDEFLQAWPRERLASMTLPDYIRCGSQESFTYWLEFKLADLGSIKGGTAIKFGIFERKDPAAPAERYEWKEGLGKTAEEAYDRIHARILATVEAVELPSLLKWKVAFLYQNRENPVFPCIYGDNYLRGVTNLTRKATHAEAVKKLMAAYEGEEDIFDFCRCIWGGGLRPLARVRPLRRLRPGAFRARLGGAPRRSEDRYAEGANAPRAFEGVRRHRHVQSAREGLRRRDELLQHRGPRARSSRA